MIRGGQSVRRYRREPQSVQAITGWSRLAQCAPGPSPSLLPCVPCLHTAHFDGFPLRIFREPRGQVGTGGGPVRERETMQYLVPARDSPTPPVLAVCSTAVRCVFFPPRLFPIALSAQLFPISSRRRHAVYLVPHPTSEEFSFSARTSSIKDATGCCTLDCSNNSRGD